MKKVFAWMFVMAALALELAACGSDRRRGRSSDRHEGDSNDSGGNPDATPPAIPGSVEIGQLTSKELEQLCDWYAELVGGYEQYQECSDVIVTPTSGSQELCVNNAENNSSGCDSTVGMWISCAKKLAAVDMCEDGEAEAAQASPECDAYYGDTFACFDIR